MRLFVAVDISEDVKKKIIDVQKQLEDRENRIKFVESENLHFTLKFLGEVKEKDVDFVCKQAGSVCAEFKPFKIQVSGVGYFGSSSYIRVIWAGVISEQLVKLAGKLNEKLASIRDEDFEYKPHLTIGRASFIGNKEKLLEKIDKLKDVNFGEVDVKEVILKESKLSSKGPAYIDYKVFKL